MPNILEELKGVIESKGLTMDNIKCCDMYLDYTYNPYRNEFMKDVDNDEVYEPVTTEFIIHTYEGVKPKSYDKHRADTIAEMGNCMYYDGFGGQELFGTVWMDNGEWITRGEYDGSEWWDYHRVPEIPNEIKLDKAGNVLESK